MAEGINDPPLPTVTEDDIIYAFTETFPNPEKENLWQRFSRLQPTLANEVLQQAMFSIPDKDISVVDARQAALKAVAFSIGAIERAIERVRTTSDGVVDAGQQPVIELGDDQ